MRRVILDARVDGDGASLQRFIDAWQDARQGSRGWPAPAHLHYILVLSEPAAARLASDLARPGPRDECHRDLAAAWPPLTRNIHLLAFDRGRVELLLVLGTPRAGLAELVADVDEFHLSRAAFDSLQDDASSPTGMIRGFKALARLAAPGAVLSITDAADVPDDCWTAAGFDVSSSPPAATGRPGVARYQPRFVPKRPPARSTAVDPSQGKHALIIGAGLAGCSAAWALAAQGWTCTLLDRRATWAAETSGNRAGLFHGVVNASDGHHARFNRAAALAIAPVVRRAVGSGQVAGSIQGALRMETGTNSLDDMVAMAAALALPTDYVEPLSRDDAQAASQVMVEETAWWYPQGGWVDPAALCGFYLDSAANAVHWHGGVEVSRLAREHGLGSPWLALDADGKIIARSDAVVMCNANDATRLLRASMTGPSQEDWLGVAPAAVRGQVSELPVDTGGLRAPAVPMAGHGYALPPNEGFVMIGSTTDAGDDDATLRASDHAINIGRFNQLTGSEVDPATTPLRGRVGWRCTAPDRLPLIGALPHEPGSRRPQAQRLDQPRLIPREPGLYIFAALASRGITTSALGARMLASWITGAPFPVEASLVDACDPARFLSRQARVGAGVPPADA